MSTYIKNNSGIDNLDFSNQKKVGKYVETNLGNKGVVVEEYLCYPEPSEWVLDSGYVLNEAEMYVKKEYITIIKEQKK
jgi:hypothetical protein